MKRQSREELILRVEVIKVDKTGIRTAICSHEEYYGHQPDLERERVLCQCAYEGFDQARNKFYGIDDLPETATQS